MTHATRSSPTPPTARVLQVLMWVTPGGGGIQTYLRCLLDVLRGTSAVEMSLAALHAGKPPPEFVGDVHLGLRQPAWRNAVRLAVHLWRKTRSIDVVHVHGALHWPMVITAVACIVRRVPFVVSPHGNLTRWFLASGMPRRRAFATIIALPLLRRAHAIVATTSWEAGEISRILPGASVAIVPPSVVAPRLPPQPSPPPPPLRIVFVGQFNRQKGLPTLIDALARVPGARLVLAGKGTEPGFEDALRRQVLDLRMDDRVEFAGYLSGADLWAALGKAHVFALPSFMENFSFATAEALCAGLPVVISSEVALAELVMRHDCGTIVRPGDPAELAGALARYQDSEFRTGRASRAAPCGLAEFAPAVMRERLEALYQTAAAPDQRA